MPRISGYFWAGLATLFPGISYLDCVAGIPCSSTIDLLASRFCRRRIVSICDKNSDLFAMLVAWRNRRNFTSFRCSSKLKSRFRGGVFSWDLLSQHWESTLLLLLLSRSKISLWMPRDWEVKLWKLAVLVTFWLLLAAFWKLARRWGKVLWFHFGTLAGLSSEWNLLVEATRFGLTGKVWYFCSSGFLNLKSNSYKSPRKG